VNSLKQALQISRLTKIQHECRVFNNAGKTKEEIEANAIRRENANRKLKEIENA